MVSNQSSLDRLPVQAADNAAHAYEWSTHPQAEQWLAGLLEHCQSQCAMVRKLAEQMQQQTGTRLRDWIDHVVLPADKVDVQQLESLGYAAVEAAELIEPGSVLYRHTGGMFPAVIVSPAAAVQLAIKVQSVTDFAQAHQITEPVQGAAGSIYRRLLADQAGQVQLWAVERVGYSGYVEPAGQPTSAVIQHHLDLLMRRQRCFEQRAQGYGHTADLLQAAIDAVGVDIACELFFEAERRYWQRRNRAAQIQKARQDRLGLGWANHDHHTYRSSREGFHRLVGLLEMLGLVCRERFYAGREAGWGAQVMVQPRVGIVVFADVDLSPDEVQDDFAHQPLPERDEFGTVGLWCELHGDSIFEAGMHHLECQFAFDPSIQQLDRVGISTMAPFTDMPCLRQAFTQGEMWPVESQRIERLLAAGHIDANDAQRFRTQGAIGSHLEILERNDGYMGFNQTGINDIIKRTNARNVAD